ncbi:hypothetical protein GCM10011391_27550 [Pullulanibacillus camelliae]|uniref:Acyl-CoA thioesterase n=1 Tax=Pullulanibacillus camelliae TaxID=1707096 RepID=A0A8J2YJW3_9BACL|nr:thioesterase family protein [Pullulanibacillus camelliae]GGE47222.1 hypothetical protein GCM10011391_27550 [Pullulanibacillus camelliae]
MSSLTTVQVRFSETDAIGHVNNVSYFIYLEQARVDFIKSLQADREHPDLFLAVVSMTCDFIRQAFFDQVLIIETTVTDIGGKSFTLKHTMKEKQTDDTIAVGQSVVVLLDREKNKAVPLNAGWKEKLRCHQE